MLFQIEQKEITPFDREVAFTSFIDITLPMLPQRFSVFALSGSILGAGALPELFAAADSGEIQFNRDIRPILSDKCFSCHGPDSNTREAGLRLDVESAAKEERDDVTVVVPGDLENSELIYRILTEDEDDVMPPPDSGKSLTVAQKETLRKMDRTRNQLGRALGVRLCTFPNQVTGLGGTDDRKTRTIAHT